MMERQSSMKAVAALEEGRVELVELPLPNWGEYDCLVRTRACGFCSGTDLKIIENRIADLDVRYPTILGHEGVGEIVAAGRRVRNYRVGDRVSCARGTCVEGTAYTFTWGEMSGYAVAHDVHAMVEDGVDLAKTPIGKTLKSYPVRKIPEGMSYEDAVMLLSFEENYSALLNFGVRPGMDLLVMGDGTVAMGLCQFAKLMGVRSITCVGHHDDKLERVRAVGRADLTVNSLRESVREALGGRTFDLAVDAVGSMELVKLGLGLLRPGGKVCVYGVLQKDQANLNLFDLPNHTGIHMLNWPHDEHRVHGEVVRLIERGELNPRDFYSHVLPVERIQEAISLIRGRRAQKVILTM